MNLERYIYFTSDFQEYEFYSEGPRGRIKTVIRFTKIRDKPIIYNLGFGDEDPETGAVNDLKASDNKDRDRVLSTVAYTIIDFCNNCGDHYILIKGSSQSRTRLYQMGISSNWNEIKDYFDVYGLKNKSLHKFRQNVNYESFLVKRK